MSEYDAHKIDYTVMVISEYAQKHGLSQKEAYARLKQCGGIAALDEFYDIEHTLPLAMTLDDLDVLYARSIA